MLKFLLIWLVGVVLVSAQEDPLEAYRGKYVSDPRFRTVCADLRKMRSRGLKRVESVFGVSPRRARSILVEIVDAANNSAGRIQRFRGAAFRTRTGETGDHSHVTIVIHSEFVRRGEYRLEEEMIHETVHAVMRERMDRRAYAAIPAWLREGMALWAAGQGETRIRSILRLPRTADLGRLLPGLEEGDRNVDRYVEDFFAFEYLARLAGDSGLPTLMRRLILGVDPHKVVEGVTKKSWDDFRSLVRSHARRRCPQFRATGWGDYLALYGLNRKRAWLELGKGSDRFLQEHPGSELAVDVRYLQGKARRLSGRPADAIPVLGVVTRDGGTHYGDDAWYQLGLANLEGGQHGGALEAFQSIVRDHPDSPLLDRAAWRLAETHLEAGNLEKARVWVRRFDESFPESDVKPRVDALRGKLD